jgi:hypothetical protein
MVQDPGGERPGTSIALRGPQGTGKGILVNTLGRLFGPHFLQLAQAGQVTGRFNGHLKDKVLVFVDEGFWAGDKQAEGVIKNMITEPFITVEQKGKDIIRVKNHVNLIIASNSTWVVPAGLEERRFFVLDISDKHQQDHQYFRAILDQMNNGGLEAMLYDLLRMDISGVNLRTFKQTEGLFEQKLYGMDTVEKYWFERLKEGTLRPIQQAELANYSTYSVGGWTGEVFIADQYADYLTFADRLKDRHPLCEQQFGLKLRKLCKGIQKRRTRDGEGRVTIRLFPTLEECRAEFCELVKLNIEWDEED